MKKIVFLNLNWNMHNIPYTTVSLRDKCIRLDYAYIASAIRDFVAVEMIDALADNLSLHELRRKLEGQEIEAVITSTIASYVMWKTPPFDLSVPAKTIRMVKKMGLKVIVIGPHGTNSPQYVYKETRADIIFRGEPEVFLPRFILSGLQAWDLPGIWTKDHPGEICPPVEVKELPIPAYDLFDLTKYPPWCHSDEIDQRVRKWLGNAKAVVMEFGRGCKSKCVFCAREGFRVQYRRKSFAQMEKEIDLAHSLGVKYIYFIDETFNMVEDDEDRLLQKLKDLGIGFGCLLRLDLLSEERIRKYYDHGCMDFGMGLDCADPKIFDAMGKNQDFRTVIKNLNFAQKYVPEALHFGTLNWYTPEYAELLGYETRPKDQWNAGREIRPYPGSILGNMLLSEYPPDQRWMYALKYMWWIQIGNQYLNSLRLRKRLKRIYLRLPRIVCQSIATLLLRRREGQSNLIRR